MTLGSGMREINSGDWKTIWELRGHTEIFWNGQKNASLNFLSLAQSRLLLIQHSAIQTFLEDMICVRHQTPFYRPRHQGSETGGHLAKVTQPRIWLWGQSLFRCAHCLPGSEHSARYGEELCQCLRLPSNTSPVLFRLMSSRREQCLRIRR